MSLTQNKHLVLVSGKTDTGKSASLRQLNNPAGVFYLNCEVNKELPFQFETADKFKEFNITDPLQIYQAFTAAEKKDDVHTIVIDTLTFLMDMYETVHVLSSSNTMKAWGQYSQYFKKLMQFYVATSTKNVIFTAHTLDSLNESEMVVETKVPIKGALKNNGIESYFSCVISTKVIPLKSLEDSNTPLLTVTPEEERLGGKYVFQTQRTKETLNERIRAPMGLWTPEETYIDNNIQLVLDRLHTYYA